MNNSKFSILTMLVAFVCTFTACKEDNSINIFSIEDDKQLGMQLAAEIASDPTTYPILSETDYPEAYQHLYRIRDEILQSNGIIYKDEFLWETKIIHDDETLNAFAGPAGYIYVYTGLIKFLESEDHFAGVLGHEIAHADRRHVTDQLTTAYGLTFLLDILLGDNQGTITDVAAGLASLSFSRGKEKEADEYSVIYLCETEWKSNGAGGFFQKLIDLGQGGGIPAFLSTHPNPDNRVEAIDEKEAELMCEPGDDFVTRYQDFKNSLP